VRIFKFKWFQRFTTKEGISDSELKEVVQHLKNGQFRNKTIIEIL